MHLRTANNECTKSTRKIGPQRPRWTTVEQPLFMIVLPRKFHRYKGAKWRWVDVAEWMNETMPKLGIARIRLFTADKVLYYYQIYIEDLFAVFGNDGRKAQACVKLVSSIIAKRHVDSSRLKAKSSCVDKTDSEGNIPRVEMNQQLREQRLEKIKIYSLLS